MRGDPSAEALSYKQVSRSASEPLPLSLVIVKTPCGQRVILREAEKKRRSRFAALNVNGTFKPVQSGFVLIVK